jgi:hypothetical protein
VCIVAPYSVVPQPRLDAPARRAFDEARPHRVDLMRDGLRRCGFRGRQLSRPCRTSQSRAMRCRVRHQSQRLLADAGRRRDCDASDFSLISPQNPHIGAMAFGREIADRQRSGVVNHLSVQCDVRSRSARCDAYHFYKVLGVRIALRSASEAE